MIPLTEGERISVPRQLLGSDPANSYVVRVVGDGLQDEAILDGDLLVIQRQTEASGGEMVVCAIGDERTIKRYFPEGDGVRLEGGSKAPPLYCKAIDVVIEGRAVALLRRFV